jgi:hypothetical protein
LQAVNYSLRPPKPLLPKIGFDISCAPVDTGDPLECTISSVLAV